MDTPKQEWSKYELVAAEIFSRIKDTFGLASVEGKQVVSGASGTEWELDAKGIKEGSEAFVIIECRRYTKSRLAQEHIGGLAFRISDTGAESAIVVSPLGLQLGAQKVASAAKIHSATLNADATPQQFVLSFLGNIFVGIAGVQARAVVGNVTAIVENNVAHKSG